MVVELKDRARRLVDASRELEAGDRDSFLRQACRDSAELWLEVVQLLESGEPASEESEVALPSGALSLAPVDPVATAGRAGKFEIVERIGAGGFGVVYKGRDPVLKRIVAVKTCTSEDEGFRKRFFREAEIAARLQHPNITTVHELGIQDGIPFLVQEYLSGEDLEEKIDRHETLAIEVKLRYLEQVARGLHYAHSQGVLHRDIKPANVRVLDDGSVKIMDFGIARLLNEETRLTSTGMTVGTVGYLAPEQLKAEEIDHRVDIFSFGVLAYELLAYTRPFRGSNFSQVCYQLLQVDPPSLSVLFPGCDPRMAELIGRCLSKEPEQRPADFACIEEELLRLRMTWSPGSSPVPLSLDPDEPTQLLDTGAEPVLRVDRPLTPAASSEGSSARQSAASASQDPFRQPSASSATGTARRPWPIALVLLAVVVAAGVGTWLWRRGSEQVEQATIAEVDRTAIGVEGTGSASLSTAEPPTHPESAAQTNRLAVETGSVGAKPEGSSPERSSPAGSSPEGSKEETREGQSSKPTRRPSGKPGQPEIEAQSQARSSETGAPAERLSESRQPSTASVDRDRRPVSGGGAEEPVARSPSLGDRRPERRESDRQPAVTPTNEASAPVKTAPASESASSVRSDPPAERPGEASGGSKGASDRQPTIEPEPDSTPVASGPIQPGTEDRKPTPIERAKPVYPERARRRRIEARVVVAVLVNEHGRVERAILKQRDDSGFGFNEAAVAAARKTLFQPATRNGAPGSMWTELPFDFRLR